MKVIFFILCLFICGVANAANVVVCDPLHTGVPGKVSKVHLSVNTPDFKNIPNSIINPKLSSLKNVSRNYWKCNGNKVVEMSQTEKNALLADRQNKRKSIQKVSAKGDIDNLTINGLLIRSLAEVIKDEINLLRSEHSLTPRTLNQLKTAIKNKIDSGDVD